MSGKAPTDFFHLLFDDRVLDVILTETTRYAEQYMEREREYLQQHPQARAHDWRRAPLTRKELLALLLAMGICGFPTLRYRSRCGGENKHILVHTYSYPRSQALPPLRVHAI